MANENENSPETPETPETSTTHELDKIVGREVREIHPEAQTCLTEYAWPGNVRELKAMELDPAGLEGFGVDWARQSPARAAGIPIERRIRRVLFPSSQ